MKTKTGLLPIQNECAYLIQDIKKDFVINLFPDDESKISFQQNKNRITNTIANQCKDAVEKNPDTDLSDAHSLTALVSQTVSSTPTNYLEIQSLLDGCLNELLQDLSFHYEDNVRWNTVLFNMAQNDALSAYIIVSSFANSSQSKTQEKRLDKLSLNLGLISSMLLSTSFEEQITLAAYDLSVEQASINKSLRIIAVVSMIIAALSFGVSFSSITQCTHQYSSSSSVIERSIVDDIRTPESQE